jgi:KUP system potassium uptake protein
VPQINWLLALGVIGLVLGFQSSNALAAAYGIAVVITMLVTTALLTVVARRLWGWSRSLTIAVMGVFFLIDLVFFAANIIKIPQGGWLPLLAGVAVFAILSTWRRGRQIILERMSEDNKPLPQFIASLNGATFPRVKGTAVYLAARRDTVPYAMTDNLRHNKVLHDRVFLLTVVTERAPYVTEVERAAVEHLGKGIARVIVRFGFAERPALPPVLERYREQIGIDVNETSFFLGRETPVPGVHPPLALWREKLFVFMARNAVSAGTLLPNSTQACR